MTHSTTPEITNDPIARRRAELPHWFLQAVRWLITLILPVFLVLTSVRLVMNEGYLWLEYHRPGFPDDPYGMTRDQRLEYGPYGIRYLLNDADIGYLGRLQLDGEPAFRAKELEHMEDVKIVTRAVLRLHNGLALMLLGGVILLGRTRARRPMLRAALSGGGVFTIGIIVTLVLGALMAWDVFFSGFHSIFFEGNSWRFYNHDTLIRLYPEQFWFDISITIGALTLLGALALIGGSGWWERRANRALAHKNGATEDPVSKR